MHNNTVPVIDLFAGPGGLAEGFASIQRNDRSVFRIGCSIEKDTIAHQTLLLRSVFRHLRSAGTQQRYYDFVAGRMDAADFMSQFQVREARALAEEEALCHELGKGDALEIDRKIASILQGTDTWVLIGGPPCQAYSLAGRARRSRDENFEADEKHFLYREYLRIIKEHAPAVFVMENVKGMLSSTHGGDSIFARIRDDLSRPRPDLEYELRSFVASDFGFGHEPADFVIESERFGVPQTRHRVILLGVRKDLSHVKHALLSPQSAMTVAEVIGDLPRIRSRLSREEDSYAAWKSAVEAACRTVEKATRATEPIALGLLPRSAGAPYLLSKKPRGARGQALRQWLNDPLMDGVAQHESRSHMRSDLARYLFASRFASEHGYSPKLAAFPAKLLPDHINAKDARTEKVPFMDRFRVQCANQPSTTVVSHIAKDGHYYIHYDPTQCRSLTVREAARLQTFPDNYYFMGNRTQQYTQVGNAVPPYLAAQLATSVVAILNPEVAPESSSA